MSTADERAIEARTATMLEAVHREDMAALDRLTAPEFTWAGHENTWIRREGQWLFARDRVLEVGVSLDRKPFDESEKPGSSRRP